MAGHRFSRLEEIEDRHPGLCRQVEAIFKTFIPVHRIIAVLRAQYGEHIGHATLSKYKWECWKAWRTEPQL